MRNNVSILPDQQRISSKWYDRPAQAVVRRSPRLLARAAIRLHRWAAQGRLTPVDVDGVRMVVSPQDMCGHQLFYYGSFEPAQMALWRSLLADKPNATIVDIGANIGLYSLVAASTPTVGRVLSFEPSPAIAPLLRYNIGLTSALAKKVSVHEVALGAEDGTVTFYCNLAEHNFGLGSLMAESEEATAVTVPSRRLDTELRAHHVDAVHLVKIDVEGAEYLVLQGMRGLLTGAAPPRLLLELHPHKMAGFGSTVAQLFGLLREAGYRILRQRGDGDWAPVADDRIAEITHLIAEPA